MEEMQPKMILGDTLDEFCHKLKFLLKSQDELSVYLDEDPNDVDISQAFQDNISNIEIMYRKIAILISDLPESDPRKHLNLCELQKATHAGGTTEGEHGSPRDHSEIGIYV